MQIVEYNSFSQLDNVGNAWDRLAKDDLFFVPSFSEFLHQTQANHLNFRMFAATRNSQIESIICFVEKDVRKFYHLGNKIIFSLPIKALTLFGSCVIGQASEDFIIQCFNTVVREGHFDLINVGRIFLDSPLYRAIKSLHNAIAWRVARKEQSWWLIRLPDSFDEYMSSLRETTTRHLSRDFRKFERATPELLIMTRPEEVDPFLRDAAEISRRTYQWDLDYGIRNDESTRQQFMRLTADGKLRCYISYLDGQPCAFGWGELTLGKFYFRQTGYDPQFRRLSPGSALILTIIRDMIENTDCRVFHFQWGGEDGYKARFGTEGHACTSMQVAQIKRPYSLLIIVLDQVFNVFKNSIGLAVERGPLKTRLRGVLRRHGVGTF
jgi:hypothetical protein